MASAALETMGFFLGLLGMVGTLVATVLPSWRASAYIGSNIVTAVGSSKGLWMECVHQSTGVFQCESYNSLLALPSDLQASRALMVVSLVLSALACILSPLGMRCTVCLEGAAAKGRVAGAAGAFFLAAGFLSVIPVAWTTHQVIQTFYQPGVPNSQKHELGDCLYVGLASALLSMLGGGVLCLSCCGEGDEVPGGRRRGAQRYPYSTRVPRAGSHAASAFHNPAAHAGVNGVAKATTLPRSSGSSHSSLAPQNKPRLHAAAGYDVTGYV